MSDATRILGEPRRAMMALARVSWQDQDGTLHTFPARIEDVSPSGACLRTKFPIEPGSSIHVTWCRDEFSAITKWCRLDDLDYLVGMQRDRIGIFPPGKLVRSPEPPWFAGANPPGVRTHPAAAPATLPPQPAPIAARRQLNPPLQPPDAPRRQRDPHDRQPTLVQPQQTPPAGGAEISRPVPKLAPPALAPITIPRKVVHNPVIGFEIAPIDSPRGALPRDVPPVPAAPHQNRKSAPLEERTHMPNKWINFGSRNHETEAPAGNGNGAALSRGPAAADAAASANPSVIPGEPPAASPQGDLLSLEDIYRSAGIVGARLGYSVNKVVEMLGSDHLRGLSDDIKRASVLMALSAAGIPLDDILQDAAQRQSAVAAYEADQRTKFEEYWTRRAEENSLLQAEVERITRQYVERMNRNQNEVEQEKKAFQKWQAAMQQEVSQISEAIAVCAPPAAFAPAASQPAHASNHILVAKSA
ncbi:MAG: hypothetical protein WA192_11215 [Candidatus Acidiferrales bacterium]